MSLLKIVAIILAICTVVELVTLAIGQCWHKRHPDVSDELAGVDKELSQRGK